MSEDSNTGGGAGTGPGGPAGTGPGRPETPPPPPPKPNFRDRLAIAAASNAVLCGLVVLAMGLPTY